MSYRPLKSLGSGALKELILNEEDYLAYRAGIHLSRMSQSDPSALTISAGGNLVGTYTDTFYDQGIGVTPDAYIPPTYSFTETDLYQNVGPSEKGPLTKNPVFWNGAGLKEMSDSELDSLIQRLLEKITANELPGSFRLGETAPSADWTVFIPNVFTDTRADGSATNYNIYIRQTGTEPDNVKPIAINRQNAIFAGLKEMTDAEIEYTLGERAKVTAMNSGIGTYQLRSSLQGPPTDPGTWEARGTALDTRLSFVTGAGVYGSRVL